MKKLALAAVIGGLVLTGAGPAHAQTSLNQTFAVVKVGASPGSVVGTGVINGAGVGDNTVGPESPPVFLISVVRLTATVNIG